MSYRPNADATILMAKTRRVFSSSNLASWSLVWLVAALLPYVVFNFFLPSVPKPQWFQISTFAFSGVALFATLLLCYRNWRHHKVLNAKGVWLLLSSAMVLAGIGKVILAVWELAWKLRPNGSPADLACIGFYLFLIGGLGLFVTQQRVSLNLSQSIILFCVSAVATGIALYLSGLSSQLPLATPVATANWAVELDRDFKPFAQLFNTLYILMDLILVILAALLSIGFWSGRLSKAWQIAALGVFSFYLADVRFVYLAKTSGYVRGDFMEFFGLAGLLLFGIAAAVEWEGSYGVKRLLH